MKRLLFAGAVLLLLAGLAYKERWRLHRIYARTFDRRSLAEAIELFGREARQKITAWQQAAGIDSIPSLTLVAFKEERRLEFWVPTAEGESKLLREIPILNASGHAGPKLREFDRQVPEGEYRILSLNPDSSSHLSLELNYPNEFDSARAAEEGRDRPGKEIFIHGGVNSVGCLALGDPAIEDLFVLTHDIGFENVRVLIAPHQPNEDGSFALHEELPPWTAGLYASLAPKLERVRTSR